MAGERYELLERIATGGMAEVFRARSVGEHGFSKTLAIKRILPSLAQDEEFVARFIAEAKLAVALTHTNIVQVFDFGRFGGSLYIAMEYVDGGDLANLLKAAQGRALPTPASVALFIAIELAKGLDYAHRRAGQPVVHRDVSPSNVLLSYAGEVKIADFGIAQAVEHARGVSDIRIMGKWRYMSPEQARGEPLDERSDIFSAGAVIFEMFTGKKLVPGTEVDDIVKNLQDMEWPALTALRPDVPRELDEALARALARKREDRYGQISELIEALTEISYSRSVRTSSLELAELVRELLPPHVEETTTRGRASLIDDIIRSEIGAREGSIARQTLAGEDAAEGKEHHKTTALRKTGAPPLPASAPAGAAFVRGEADDRGITTWRLAAEAAEAARRKQPSWKTTVLQLGLAGALVALAVAAVVTTQSRGAPPPPRPPPPLATVMVMSTPSGADVYVDGRPTNLRTPVTDGLKVPPGLHRVAVRVAGYLPQEMTQTFQVGMSAMVPFTLEREPRVLAVGSEPPAADLKVDGLFRGRTPLEVSDLVAGDHDVLLEARGYDPWRRSVTMPESGTLSIAPSLVESRKFGKVLLNANVYARVYVDQARKPFCETPCNEVPLEAGRRRLRFESPLLGTSVERTIDVKPGQTTALTDVVIEKK